MSETQVTPYPTDLLLGERVHIDGDASITAVVTAICWRQERSEIEIQWFNNGSLLSAWLSPWRLSRVSA